MRRRWIRYVGLAVVALLAAPPAVRAQDRLPQVTVSAADVCRSDAAGADPLALAALWQEGREFAWEQQRLMRRYGWVRTFQWQREFIGGMKESKVTLSPKDGTRLRNDPLYWRARDSTRGAGPTVPPLARRGWRRTNFRFAEVDELLAEDFLREHCFEPRVVLDSAGQRALRFGSRYRGKKDPRVAGTVIFGPRQADVRSIELEYLTYKGAFFGRSRRLYQDADFLGTIIRVDGDVQVELTDPSHPERRFRGVLSAPFTELTRAP